MLCDHCGGCHELLTDVRTLNLPVPSMARESRTSLRKCVRRRSDTHFVTAQYSADYFEPNFIDGKCAALKRSELNQCRSSQFHTPCSRRPVSSQRRSEIGITRSLRSERSHRVGAPSPGGRNPGSHQGGPE